MPDEQEMMGKGKGRESRWAIHVCRAGLAAALVAVVAAIASGFGSRVGLWGFRGGFKLLTWAAYCGVLAVTLSLVGEVLAVRQRHLKGCFIALCGLVVGAATVAVPVSWRVSASRVPPIHDITTDVDHPPQFVAILPLRKNALNPPAYGGAEVAIKQRAAYPDIKTVILTVPQKEAFERALDTARALGWRIVAAVPTEGRIEATDTTFWFGFTDDVVIRVSAADYRALVDIRSVSRVGRSDVGTNAKRIRAFIAKLTGAG
ncbi:MAG TPA: DUF1499 domain-containing protein [Geobacteraceae bacterium]